MFVSSSANRHLLTPLEVGDFVPMKAPEAHTRTNLFNYADESSDDEDEEKKGDRPEPTHYNDLEELD